MFHISEVTGTDKPILISKEKGTFTYEEIIYTGQDPANFEHAAFLTTEDESLFDKLYSKQK